jgi:hypothetical protein
MRRLNPILIGIVVGMAASASSHAIVLHATLTNAQENPPALHTLTHLLQFRKCAS